MGTEKKFEWQKFADDGRITLAVDRYVTEMRTPTKRVTYTEAIRAVAQYRKENKR